MSDFPQEEIFRIFFPHTFERAAEAKSKDTKFVHYTSASTALSIIQKKKVWMRSSLMMNDFQEINHGQSCVKSAWHDDVVGTRMKAALHRIDEGIWKRVCDLYNNSDFAQRTNSYLVSVSEHGGSAVEEDKYGRLSMWRAYGGDTNVALVLNNEAFQSESAALDTYTSPVLYADEGRFKLEFLRIVENVENNISLLATLDAEFVAQNLFTSLLFATLSTKHPGFSEEREWRVLHVPSLYPNERMDFDIETIDGVPQKVYKLPLNDIPEEGFEGVEVRSILSEVIIGPTEYPYPIYDAFVSVLTDAGIENAEQRVRISGIPLRRS